MSRLRAFLRGIAEVRSDFTTNYDHERTPEGDARQDAYERGRIFAARFARRELTR